MINYVNLDKLIRVHNHNRYSTDRTVKNTTEANNYQLPQLPRGNMADADLSTGRYSLLVPNLSTHWRALD